jgi:hypothetical protein
VDLKLYARSQRDRLAAAALVLAGAIALLIGYVGVSGKALLYQQLPYLVSGGLFGIALIGVGTTLWLSADLQDEWRKLDRVEEALRALVLEDGSLATDLLADEDYADAAEVPARPAPRRRVARASG